MRGRFKFLVKLRGTGEVCVFRGKIQVVLRKFTAKRRNRMQEKGKKEEETW